MALINFIVFWVLCSVIRSFVSCLMSVDIYLVTNLAMYCIGVWEIVPVMLVLVQVSCCRSSTKNLTETPSTQPYVLPMNFAYFSHSAASAAKVKSFKIILLIIVHMHLQISLTDDDDDDDIRVANEEPLPTSDQVNLLPNEKAMCMIFLLLLLPSFFFFFFSLFEIVFLMIFYLKLSFLWCSIWNCKEGCMRILFMFAICLNFHNHWVIDWRNTVGLEI